MSNQFPSTDTLKISNIQLINIPSRHGTYLVEISHNEEVKKRSQKKKVDGNHIVWPESLSFTITDLTDKSLWYFKVVKTRLFLMEKTVMSHKKKLLDLLQLQKNSGLCKLTISKDYQLTFTIERRGNALPGLVNETENALAGASTSEHVAKIAEHVMKAQEILVAQEDLWMSFLPNFKIFMSTVDRIAEIHPYVQLAWSILSVIPKTIIAQNERDDSINKLSQHLKEVYEYLTDAKRLPTLTEMQVKALSALVKQTIECAYFLKEYATSNKTTNILKGVNIDKKVDDFNENFDHILDVMKTSTTLEINIVTLRISDDLSELRDKVEELKNFNLLEGMPRGQNAGFLSAKTCLPGTRQGLIAEILDWVNASGNSSQRVFLLLGQAGMGKSAVAHTISHIFDTQNRLGSIFSFSQSYKENRNVLFSTITRELADGDVQWRKSLVQVIEKTSVRTSLDTKTQFDELIVKPSKAVDTIGPVVIVIDGLDESGDRGERAVLLDLLFKRCSELPTNYRLVITSRPELDIESWCTHPTVFCKRMADIDAAETTKDIQKYISSRLSSVKSIIDEELDNGWQFLLAKRSEGVFQWAKLACDVINRTIDFGVGRRVKKFIYGPTSSLYQMYHEIFLSRPEFEEEGYLSAFKTIMGALIVMRKPLSIQALQSLFQNDFPHRIKSIIDPFHSLFLGTHDLCTPVRPLHTSLTDFLTTRSIEVVDGVKERKNIQNRFYVDTSDQGSFTLTCLKLMNSGEGGLRFNICDLETSHILNRDVPDLDGRVQKQIPLHLSYASYFWAVHLQQSKISEDLLAELRLLMRANVLYLFETLSLLEKSVDQVCVSMKFLVDWCKGIDDELASQAEDACQFGYDFGGVMVESTPHLYISALPFAQNGSFIRDQYLNSFPHHFNIELGQSLEFLPSSNAIKRHPYSSKPTAVAFSPQGRYIATGFKNGDFWLWDYNTGAMVHQWETDEQNSEICTVVFSQDGESVTSCFLNGSFKILNIPKNEVVPHSYGVFKEPCIYSTISNDGCYLVFHFRLEEVLLYHIASRSTIRLGFSAFKSIFSHNGNLLASLVRDNPFDTAIPIWNIQKQELIGTLDFDDIIILDMAFSPDDNHMALLCRDIINAVVIIEIWDVLTAAKVHRLALGHWTMLSPTVMFSPDGQNVLFYTNLGIQNINILTGVLTHTRNIPCQNIRSVTSFAVSSDYKHVAWVMENGVIQVQEYENTPRRVDPIQNELRYRKAMLSPLNTYLVLQGYNDNHNYLQILNSATMLVISQAQLKNFIIAISPNDKYVAYAAPHGLCLWSDKGGELVLDPSDREFTALDFSFTGDCLIAGDQVGTVMIWKTHTCQLVCPPYTVMPLKTRIMALAFSGTGIQFTVIYSSGSNKMLEIYSSQSGKSLRGPFVVHPSSDMHNSDFIAQCTLAFSANETHILYIQPQIGLIIDAETGQTLKTFKFEACKFDRSNFLYGQHIISPNKKYITLTEGKSVEVWDIDTGEEVYSEWFDCSALQAIFSNNSEEFAIMDGTRDIHFRDISSGDKTARPTFYYPNEAYWDVPKIMSINNKYLVAIQDTIVKVWSLETYHDVLQHQSSGRELHTSSVDSNHSKGELFDGAIRDQSLLGPDDQERADYALVAWKKALFSNSSKINKDGWVLGPNGEILFWVPEERRKGLWRPKMVHLMGAPVTKLNFDNFVHGSSWTECKEKL